MLLEKNQIDLILVFVIQRNKNSGWSGKLSRKFSRNEYNLEPWSECCWKKFAVSLLYFYMMFWVYQQCKVITTQPKPFLRVVLAACNLDGWGNVFSETKSELAYCLAIAIPNSNEFLKLTILQLWHNPITCIHFTPLNCGVGEDFWEYLGLQGDPTSPF